MRLSRIALLSVAVVFLAALVACSNKGKPNQSAPAQQPNAVTAPAPESAPVPSQPRGTSAPANTGQKPTGPQASEKYRLDLTNYSNVAVTVKVNGEWVGQWDNSTSVPLDMVVKGENQLTVELASQPKGTLTVTINTTRDGQGVSILSLNFQGQSGTHSSTFVAR